MKYPRWLVAGLVCAPLLAGCLAHAQYASSQPASEIYVNSGPPPRVAEYPPAPPGPGYGWINGYWDWNGYGWSWVSGYWAPVRPNYVFVQPSYVVVDGRWVYRRGYWNAGGRRDYNNARSVYAPAQATPVNRAAPAGSWRGSPTAAPAAVSAPASRPAAATSLWQGNAPNAVAPSNRLSPVGPAASMRPQQQPVMAAPRPNATPMPRGNVPPAGHTMPAPTARVPYAPAHNMPGGAARPAPAPAGARPAPGGARVMPHANQPAPGASAVMGARRPAPQPVQPR